VLAPSIAIAIWHVLANVKRGAARLSGAFTRTRRAQCHNGVVPRSGRPPKPVSRERVEADMLAGISIDDVARRHSISRRALQRRIAEWRRELGPTWGKPLPVPREPVTVATLLPTIRDTDDVDVPTLLRRARVVLGALMASPDDAARLAAVKVALDHADRLEPVSAQGWNAFAGCDDSEMLDAFRKAVGSHTVAHASAPAPEPAIEVVEARTRTPEPELTDTQRELRRQLSESLRH
jgi:hypothetical protein